MLLSVLSRESGRLFFVCLLPLFFTALTLTHGRSHSTRHPPFFPSLSSLAQGVRPNVGAAVGYLDGELRQRRWLLPLLVRRGPRLRPHRAGRHLRARLPAHRRGLALRHPLAAEEDSPVQRGRVVVPSLGNAFRCGGWGGGVGRGIYLLAYCPRSSRVVVKMKSGNSPASLAVDPDTEREPQVGTEVCVCVCVCVSKIW